MDLGMLRKTSAWLTCGVVAAWLLAAGCDSPPTPPKLGRHRVEVLEVSPAERGELKAAAAVEAARINYRYRLQVLQGYYEQVGNMDKLTWARRELKNLDNAQTFAWSGLPEIFPPTGERVAGADERVLVEYVVAARQEYKRAVGELVEFYRRAGQDFRARLIANMQARLDPIRTYRYFLSAEIPPADMKPAAVVPQADALFQQALRLHRQGKGFLPALTTNYPKQRQALLKFRELIEKYPTSNKIALSAYYIGEIYKEYFNENIRSVHWYERAWQWDPNITKPARFQAATVYDIRLHDYERAIDCYRLVIKHEQFNAGNVNYAHKRIGELTGK